MIGNASVCGYSDLKATRMGVTRQLMTAIDDLVRSCLGHLRRRQKPADRNLARAVECLRWISALGSPSMSELSQNCNCAPAR